jgi:hypothetical protein
MSDISDELFDSHHVYYADKGEQIHVPPRLRSRSVRSVVHGIEEEGDGEGEERRSRGEDDVWHSVYLATGVSVHPVGSVHVESLQGRPEDDRSSVKARFNWFGALCLAGVGMFVEAYIIITTGQVKTVWHAAYPTCWEPTKDQHCPDNIRCCGLFPNTPVDDDGGTCAVDTGNQFTCTADGTYREGAVCKESVIASISYTEFACIMVGMVAFGVLGDAIGRNSAGILTSILMFAGVTVMAFVDTVQDDLQRMFLIWAVFFGVFGLGVGGEYPLSASNAAERDYQAVEEAKGEDEDHRRLRVLRDQERTARRGETIGMVFAMQGIGAVVGSTFLLVLLYFSGQCRTEWYVSGGNSVVCVCCLFCSMGGMHVH